MYNKIIEEVSKEINLPEDLIRKTYSAYWKAIKEKISELPLKENLTEKEFETLRTCFNIPSLGKFSCTQEKYLKMKKTLQYIKNRSKNAKRKKD